MRRMTPLDRRRASFADGPLDARLEVVTPESAGAYAAERDEHRKLEDGEDRPPREWENDEAEWRAAVHAVEQERQAQQRRASRRTRDVWDRLRDVAQQLLKLQSPAALRYQHATARSGADSTAVMPAGGRHGDVAYADPAEVDARLKQITVHVEALEDLLDQHHGLVPPKPVDLMTKDEKDALILSDQLRGLSPEQINALYGPAIGAPRTIRLVRNDAGLNQYGTGPKRARRPPEAA